jgi:formylglycine-generating enzyme required for sulfatase activity
MTGNVWEWCPDRYGYHREKWEEGTGLRITSSENRVIRGGSFAGIAAYARSADRNLSAPEVRSPDIGARAARAISDKDYR